MSSFLVWGWLISFHPHSKCCPSGQFSSHLYRYKCWTLLGACKAASSSSFSLSYEINKIPLTAEPCIWDMHIYKIRVALHQREHNGMHCVFGQETQGAHHEPPWLTASMGNTELFIHCPGNKNLKSKNHIFSHHHLKRQPRQDSKEMDLM